ncbi:hypothetical protein B0J11DRAFT_576732, partial [Dendryphion nanum]
MNTLQAVIKHLWKSASRNMSSFQDGVFEYPFWDLVNHKEELLMYKSDQDGLRSKHSPEYNEMCDQHIDKLIDYLYSHPKLPMKEFKSDWNETNPMTTFMGAGFLFKPGTDVYVEENNEYNAYVIDSVHGGIDHENESQIAPYTVYVWRLVFDGNIIRRGRKMVTIPVFDNRRPISTLPLYPVHFHDETDGGERRRNLIKRGEMYFRSCKKPTFLEYAGVGGKAGKKHYSNTRVVVEHDSRPWEQNSNDYDTELRWIEQRGLPARPPGPRPPPPVEISPEMFVNSAVRIGETSRIATCPCRECADASTSSRVYLRPGYSDYDQIDPFDDDLEKLSPHQHLLCSSHMFAYILKDRTYDLLDVNGLVEPDISERAIDRLVMKPESNKDMIKAIVKTYTDQGANRFRADFIHGKGEGQIILLHGPPGTGKTLTAESVSEYTRRPLLSITTADLGHEPKDLETNLLTFFKNASDWDAVVLLDEADVYLERRDAKDMQRNSIVAVFQRALEYFQDIMFLTTNRVGQFDEAFLSRIHVSISYDPLDNDARHQIWDNLFAKLQEDFERNRGIEI